MPVPFGKWRPDIFDLNSGVASEARGVLPGPNAKRPWPGFVQLSLAVGAPVLSGYLARKSDGGVAIYAGTTAGLYLFTGAGTAWTDVSQTPYTVPDGDRWSFDQFGTTLIACNGGDDPQALDVDAGSDATDLAGSPPTARFVKVVGDQVWLYGLAEPNKVIWSGRNDETFWTPGSRDCDIQVFPEGGAVLGVSSLEAGLVFQEAAIRRFGATTDQTIYGFIKAEDNRGLVAPYSLITRGAIAYFLSEEGFFAMSGSGAMPIGLHHVDDWVASNIDRERRGLVTGCVDPLANRLFWAIPTISDGGALMNVILCYDVTLQEWTYAEIDMSFLMPGATPGTTLEGLDALGYTLDTLPLSLDSSAWKPGAPLLAGFDADGILGFFSGPAMAALVETAEFQAIPGRRAFVRGVSPLTQGAGVTVQVGSRESLQSSRVWTAESTLQRTGVCPVRSSGRYHRVRASYPEGATDWTGLAGVEIDAVQDGEA